MFCCNQSYLNCNCNPSKAIPLRSHMMMSHGFLNHEHDGQHVMLWCNCAIVYAYSHTMHQFSTTHEQNSINATFNSLFELAQCHWWCVHLGISGYPATILRKSQTNYDIVIMLCFTHSHSTHSQASALINELGSHPVIAQNMYDPGCATRANQSPVCTHFTKMHWSIYPSAFCMNCEWWEWEVDLCNKHVSCQSKTYSCKVKHYSWFVPHPLWTVSNNCMLS